jgi:hypothetical protein
MGDGPTDRRTQSLIEVLFAPKKKKTRKLKKRFSGYELQFAVIYKRFELNTCKEPTFEDLFKLFPNLTNFLKFGSTVF